ncbi:Membrane protein involved in the export of O-antigen and teichoic acid [Pedobacter sp. ok626]|uniref:oligosaccharide flippase family protein n=1 Tax=Pedobacter sp. ok626 TaxID=1761882 RepID=UPI0008901772|nr:oligosaccharide flippase family protein [Pedobacter sp. ok626]SDJ32601.1 Membrane protein involved in the export of O-antigen and teichoic acid [Pedobacter sp. ok626]
MSNTKTIFGKNEIVFTFFRYLTYGIQTTRGLILAYFLGPYFLGIYGYLMLYQQYLSYTNLGLNYSVNSELSLLKNGDSDERMKIINSSFSGVLIISMVLCLVAILFYFLRVQLFPFRDSHKYIFVILILTILTHFQQIFINIFRIDKKLKPIIVGELILSSGLLIVVPFFKGIDLVNAVFYVWVLILFGVVCLYRIVYGKKIAWETTKFKILLKSGIPLLVYAFSYYLMGLMVRTLIGAFYSVEIMGYFSFANNITTAVMLGLDTITWIIFPSVIAKLAIGNLDNDELCDYLVSFTNNLFVLVTVIVGFSIASLPILLFFLPKYKPVEFSLIVLLVNQIIFNSGFVFVSLCIARKMHKEMAVISLLAVGISAIISIFFCFYGFSYIWLVISNIIGSLCFINGLIYYVSKKFALQQATLRKSLSWYIQLILCSIILATLLKAYWLVLLLLGITLIFKFKSVKDLYVQLAKVLSNNVR